MINLIPPYDPLLITATSTEQLTTFKESIMLLWTCIGEPHHEIHILESVFQLDDGCFRKLRHPEVLWVWYVWAEADACAESPRSRVTAGAADVRMSGDPESAGVYTSRHAGMSRHGFPHWGLIPFPQSVDVYECDFGTWIFLAIQSQFSV